MQDRNFFYFSHLSFSKKYWKRVLSLGDAVIDATCGNGHDTLFLAKSVLTKTEGNLFAYDIQELALKNTKERLKKHLNPDQFDRVTFLHRSHENIDNISFSPIKLIVYNLGYLPQSDKSITTVHDSSLRSIKKALLIAKYVSITCYPGHKEGKKEKDALLHYLKMLSPLRYKISHFQRIAKKEAPSFLWIHRGSS